MVWSLCSNAYCYTDMPGPCGLQRLSNHMHILSSSWSWYPEIWKVCEYSMMYSLIKFAQCRWRTDSSCWWWSTECPNGRSWKTDQYQATLVWFRTGWWSVLKLKFDWISCFLSITWYFSSITVVPGSKGTVWTNWYWYISLFPLSSWLHFSDEQTSLQKDIKDWMGDIMCLILHEYFHPRSHGGNLNHLEFLSYTHRVQICSWHAHSSRP